MRRLKDAENVIRSVCHCSPYGCGPRSRVTQGGTPIRWGTDFWNPMCNCQESFLSSVRDGNWVGPDVTCRGPGYAFDSRGPPSGVFKSPAMALMVHNHPRVCHNQPLVAYDWGLHHTAQLWADALCNNDPEGVMGTAPHSTNTWRRGEYPSDGRLAEHIVEPLKLLYVMI